MSGDLYSRSSPDCLYSRLGLWQAKSTFFFDSRSKATEFANGAYSNFAAGVPAATLEQWTLPLKAVHLMSANGPFMSANEPLHEYE